jgi:spore coat polysaccharide biosynthesis predicted glycosyltransferase SpsG|tara:strand:- start:424 stop:1323 length:900 start_codon:yes stop_codon:yes gene_type:complete
MGHLFRMMNLYEAIAAKGIAAVFVLLGEHAPSEDWLKSKKLKYEVIDDEFGEWEAPLIRKYCPVTWINDRLDTDERHALKIKSHGIKLVTFDDGGGGAKHADIHVAALTQAHQSVLRENQLLTGLAYLILSQEISHYQHLRTSADKLVVSLGGSDTHGMTVKVVDYLAKTERPATIILGPGFMHEEALGKVISGTITIKRNVPSLAAEFANYDFAITGGGITAFEAAAAGLPALNIANEYHEIGFCKYLEELGCSVYAGYLDDADLQKLEDMSNIQSMSMSGIEKVTLSGAENVLNKIN